MEIQGREWAIVNDCHGISASRPPQFERCPEEALEELETMYKIYLRDSSGNLRISRVVTLSKKQVLILKAVDKRLLKV
jgi:hypothetical protein